MNALNDFSTHNLKPLYTLSLASALLMGVYSLAGLLFQSVVYPSEELRQFCVSNDLVNLLIGLPILLGSMAVARQGRLIGLLFWPGALFYNVYNYTAYTIATAFSLASLAYLALVVLSLYAMIRLLASINPAAVQQQLKGAVPERVIGGILAGFGILFFVFQLTTLLQALSGQTVISRSDLAMSITDLLITPTWVIGGILLWRRRAFGYLSGAGLLFQASMLFVGLLAFFILQPLVASIPFPMQDFVVVLVMGLVCFVPFGIFLRGVLSGPSRA